MTTVRRNSAISPQMDHSVRMRPVTDRGGRFNQEGEAGQGISS